MDELHARAELPLLVVTARRAPAVGGHHDLTPLPHAIQPSESSAGGKQSTWGSAAGSDPVSCSPGRTRSMTSVIVAAVRHAFTPSSDPAVPFVPGTQGTVAVEFLLPSPSAAEVTLMEERSRCVRGKGISEEAMRVGC